MDKEATGVNKFALVARRFAVQVKSYEAERACGLTFHFSVRHVDACETRAAREGIKRPCGPEKSKYRQRCQGFNQVSDGLVHQVQVQSFAGHAPLNCVQYLAFRFVRLVQWPSASSVPGGFVWSNVEAQWSGNH